MLQAMQPVPPDTSYYDAMAEVNQTKNRHPDILPSRRYVVVVVVVVVLVVVERTN